MDSRDKYLMMAGHEQGFQNAGFIADDDATLAGAIAEESERWAGEVIADNGGTIGDFIAHEAPQTGLRESAEALLMMFVRDGYATSTGKPTKKTGIALMKYVAADPELQRLVNIGDYQAILKYRAT